MSMKINGIYIPDSPLAKEATELVRDTESELLFNHSSRVYYWGALAGGQRGLKYDAELLYIGCMFHDMGLTHKHSSKDKRFEVDGANAAREFLKRHPIGEHEINLVWTAIALHTTPGIPEFMDPIIALVTAGVEMDVLGINYHDYDKATRDKVVAEYPRSEHFKEDIIQAFYDGIKGKPLTTFGNVKGDVIADKDHSFKPYNFCSIIRQSSWKG
ncbi:HD domain-containing protein [Legionella fallonii]|uniref:Metal-dependent phosphohydrolase HD sub domain-containing protein n=1 Tax=Legionella fallonii LLAP-10 TaxID=1212491 RepID=A0A098G8V3_9GAMM|nr:HD domain-containing protein [Legionella fallonii]CEG58396.1 Metal-dependent phosphohydrolase HD sub domain-containing protein [Legionella fallonii LLAP-10]